MAISFATIDINSTYTSAQETVDYFEYSAATFELGPQYQQVLLRGMEAYARTHFSDEQVSFSRIRSHFYHHTYITISVARRGAIISMATGGLQACSMERGGKELDSARCRAMDVK
jgi:hypothetical protein